MTLTLNLNVLALVLENEGGWWKCGEAADDGRSTGRRGVGSGQRTRDHHFGVGVGGGGSSGYDRLKFGSGLGPGLGLGFGLGLWWGSTGLGV